jgi:hypothetical protein
MIKLIESLKELAKSNPQGFTVDLELNFITSGYVIAVKDTQDSFGDEGLERVVEFATTNKLNIGGWDNDGLFYWDAVIIETTREKAIEAGELNKQLAIFDLDNQELIWI